MAYYNYINLHMTTKHRSGFVILNAQVMTPMGEHIHGCYLLNSHFLPLQRLYITGRAQNGCHVVIML